MAGILEELLIKIGADPKDAERKVRKFRGVVEQEMDKVEHAGALAGAGLVAGLAEGIGQEASSDLLAAQLDLTAEESERAGAVAGELFASAYGDSFGEVNQALRGVIAQTGELGDVTDAELADLGANALTLAKVLETDVTRAVEVAGITVQEGLADNTEEAFDLMLTASRRTMPGMIDEVLDATEEYSQFFRVIGYDGEQALGLLAAASAGGRYEIDKTGDAIKEFTIRATDMSTASVEAFEEIGLDAQEMSNQILAGGDTAAGAFETIVEGLLSIEDPTDRANAAISLFGTPIEDLAVSDIPDFLAGLIDTESALGDVSGAVDDTGDALRDNAQTALTEFGRTVREEVVAAFEPFLPQLTELAQALLPLTPFILGVAAALVIAAGVLKVVRGVIIAVTIVQWLWNAALWANPITWIIAAVLALIAIVVLLVVYWDEIAAELGKIWDSIKLAFSAAWDWITDKFFAAMAAVQSAVASATQWISDKWDDTIGFFKKLPGRISSAVSGMWDGIKEAFKSALNWLIGKWNGLSFGVPSVDMGSLGTWGGFDISTPNIPYLASGGIVTGPTLAMIGEGADDEVVAPLPNGARDFFAGGGGGGGRVDLYLHLDGDDAMVEMVRRGVSARGGDVQLVLGGT